MPRSRRWNTLGLLVLLAGCRLSTLPAGGYAEQRKLSVVGEELRVRVRAFAGPYTGAIEEAADAAARDCSEAGVRLHALEWKLSAVPQMQDALFEPDPAVALLEGWAYAVQMQGWLESPAGRGALGECRTVAAAAMGNVARRAREFVDEVAPGQGQEAEDFVRRWAATHPLRSLFLPRITIAPSLASESARRELGALAAIGTVVETVADLTARIAAYRETLLKEAAWTGELSGLRATSSDVARQASADVRRMVEAAERIGRLTDRIPQLIERERLAGLVALRAERKEILADIDAQRTETLALLQSERAVVLDRIDAVGRTAIDTFGDRAEAVVDRAFVRAAQLGLGLLIVATIGGVLVTWARRLPLRSLHRPG